MKRKERTSTESMFILGLEVSSRRMGVGCEGVGGTLASSPASK